MPPAAGSWSATATLPRARSRRRRGGSRYRRRGSTTAAQANASPRPSCRRTAALESHRGAAAPLPARAVDRRLRAGALGLLRLRGRTLRLHRAAADRGLAGGARSLAAASLAAVDYVYLCGVHFNVRLAEDRLCCLVLVGVRPDGSKELVAVTDGYREDKQSWLDLLRDLSAPEVVTGDGALGFWGALARSSPPPGSRGVGCTRRRMCWRRCPIACGATVQAIYTAETRAAALDAARDFGSNAAWSKARRPRAAAHLS